jgi:hypothetical protein
MKTLLQHGNMCSWCTNMHLEPRVCYPSCQRRMMDTQLHFAYQTHCVCYSQSSSSVMIASRFSYIGFWASRQKREQLLVRASSSRASSICRTAARLHSSSDVRGGHHQTPATVRGIATYAICSLHSPTTSCSCSSCIHHSTLDMYLQLHLRITTLQALCNTTQGSYPLATVCSASCSAPARVDIRGFAV